MQMQNRLSNIFLPLLIQTLLVYCLNSFNTIQWCALVFSLFTLHILYLTERTTIITAFGIHLSAILINLLMSMNKVYYIHGKPIDGLFIASYFSVFSSIFLGLFFFTKIKRNSLASVRYLLSSILVSIMDGLGMTLFFINVYELDRVLQIFIKEVTFKVFYITLILVTIYSIKTIMGKMQGIKRDY